MSRAQARRETPPAALFAASGTSRRRPAIALIGGLTALSVATAAMLAGREPFATWYYPCAWFATLIAADGFVALRSGSFRLLARPAHVETALAWSAVLWLVFELANLRLRNWYYVFVPPAAAARWAGILLSFATVLPAVFLSEAVLRVLGVGTSTRTRPLRVTPGLRRALVVAGAALTALPLLWPRWFFPLVWVGPTLVLDPLVHRRAPDRSLLGDLESGRPGRPLRLLAGGAAIGLLWELFNVRARSKWIYTVPGFEELKLFEMPLAGFLGFPPFALECFATWQGLVLAGLAVPRVGVTPPAPAARRVTAAALALLLTVTAMLGLQRWTVSSVTPSLSDVPFVPAAELRARGYDVWRLARSTPSELAEELRVDPARARWWIERAQVVTLRGIGGENARLLHAAGVSTVGELARSDPERLAARLAGRDGQPAPERVRVWVRAARDDGARR